MWAEMACTVCLYTKEVVSESVEKRFSLFHSSRILARQRTGKYNCIDMPCQYIGYLDVQY